MPLTKVSSQMIGSDLAQASFAPNAVIYENATTLSANYTIPAGSNAMSAGPITVANGVTVTIPVGSVWSIV
jgi:hypothetical protein